uniref:Uncharacterized protein n=1 Tax=Avena sativa TaxID=4498 RepID=A0ACD5WDF9_AVESA
MALARRLSDSCSAPVIFDRWKSLGDRPLPSPPSSPKGVSFPNAKVCEVLDKIWASRRLSLPEQCDYADHVTTALGEMSIRDTSSAVGVMSMRDTSTALGDEVRQTAPPLCRPISARVFPSWQLQFFIREDTCGLFHTYPPLDGPFRSVQAAEDAFARHLDELRSPEMCTDGLSQSEICIRSILYWPDGTRKKSSKSCHEHRNIVLLVQSLLDKYNEDHDPAYELEDVVSYGEIYERESRHIVFYHINLTTKPKRADGFHSDDGNLFFAEVTCLNGENEEYVLNSLCVVKPTEKGRCYGCENNGSVDLKHPIDADKYKRGRSRPYPQCLGFDLPREMLDDFCAYHDEEARLAAEESRIRRIYKCLDDKVSVAKPECARRAAPADSSKRDAGQGKGLVPAKLDIARSAAPAYSSEREAGSRPSSVLAR